MAISSSEPKTSLIKSHVKKGNKRFQVFEYISSYNLEKENNDYIFSEVVKFLKNKGYKTEVTVLEIDDEDNTVIKYLTVNI